MHGKRLMAMVVMMMAVGGSVAFAMSSGELATQRLDEARVQSQIDGRLHDVLVKMRMQRGR